MRAKLDELATLDPEVLPESTNPNFAFRYLDISSVSTGRIDMPSELTSFADAPSRARMVVRPGDVLMSTVRPGLKAFARYVGGDENVVASTGFAVLRANDWADGRFLFNALLSDEVSAQIEQVAVGSNYPAINGRDVKRLTVPKFPLVVQQRIATILTSLDTAIEATEALIEKHKQIKAGLVQDLFTRGISATGQLRPTPKQSPELYRRFRNRWIPLDWNEVELQAVADVSRGKFTHRPRNDPRYLGGPHPFIQTGDIAASAGDYLATYSQTLSELGASVSSRFPAGTVAVTIAANIADTAILAEPMYFPDSVVGVVVRPEADVRFIELCIRLSKPRLEAMAPQSAQKNINLQDLRPFKLLLPPLEEQVAISQRYEAALCPIKKLRVQLDKLRMQKQGLMQDLLTGKVRVPLPEAEPTAA